jgi:hypothetical protein
MAYFIILPLWLVAVAGIASVTIATRFVPRFGPAYPFVWRILLWTSVGFLFANGLVLVFYVVAARLAGSLGPPPHPVSQVVLGSALLLAPIAGSVGGFLGGLAFGVWLAMRAMRKQRARTG